MLTSDLTSLVPPQFSPWLQVRKLAPFIYLSIYSSRRRIWFASVSTFLAHVQSLPASIPGKLGSKLPKVSMGQRPCKNKNRTEQNRLDWTTSLI